MCQDLGELGCSPKQRPLHQVKEHWASQTGPYSCAGGAPAAEEDEEEDEEEEEEEKEEPEEGPPEVDEEDESAPQIPPSAVPIIGLER